ncbi:MAG: TIGR03546 family protein [Nitrospirota bacterium]|nr:TIGR03546 family protein [Nitrospirota bacterium]
MFRLLLKFLRVLGSDTDPLQISLGFALAMIAGFTPLFSLHNLIVLLLVLVLRVNLSAFLAGLALFTGLAFLLDPLFHQVGRAVLTSDALRGPFTAFYNTTPGRLSHFYNTIVMGSLVVSLVLFVPFLLLSNALIVRYRTQVLGWVNRLKVVQALKTTRLWSTLQRAQAIRDDLS